PYEPIVHGTLEINQSEPLDMLVIRIIEDLIQIVKDFFTIVINGSNGFGHPDYNGKTTPSSVYINRIINNVSLPPTFSPVTSNSKIYNSVEWKNLNQTLLNSKRQQKINQDWADVYNTEINKLIKESIPDGCTTEISRWRKAFNVVVLVIENEKICFEDYLKEIRDLNFTFNYLQE
ncbi:27868_t:CDS:2, partial [Racocetra persica]